MICPKCNTEVSEGAKFCPSCGQAIGPEAAAEQQNAAAGAADLRSPAANRKGMKNCKHCGAVIAKSAKSCPHCGGKNKKPIYLRWWFILLVVLFLIAFAGTSGTKTTTAENTAEKTSGSASGSSSVSSSNSKIGKDTSAEDSAFEITNTKFHTYINSLSDNKFWAIVEVTNTGAVNLYLDGATFDIEDQEGHLIATEDFVSHYPSVIEPGEKGYFYVDGGSLNEHSASGSYQLVANVDVEKAKIERVRLETSDVTVSPADFWDLKCVGRVDNTTDETWLIPVLFLYDSNHEILDVSITNIMDAKTNAKNSFEISIDLPDGIDVSQVASYELIVETYAMQF